MALFPTPETLNITSNAAHQSSHLYCQAAGSDASDGSAKGIHLRWIFKNKLGENHLAKGDHWSNQIPFSAETDGLEGQPESKTIITADDPSVLVAPQPTTNSFNRGNDWVRIFRFPYLGLFNTINLTTPPQVVNDSRRTWVYQQGGRAYQLRLPDLARYSQARTAFDPRTNPQGFLDSYGDGVLELECLEGLFFKARFGMQEWSGSAELKAEVLTVESEGTSAEKQVAARQTFTSSSVNGAELQSENLRSVRFTASNCSIQALYLEFYADQVDNAISRKTMDFVGKYALYTDDARAESELEPSPGLVHAKWPRYNDNAFVNTQNYIDRWKGIYTDPTERNLKQIVQAYLNWSYSGTNPKAIEPINIYLSDGERETYEVSNLDLLQVAATDYHTARMLGLGTLDVEAEVFSGDYMYVAEYITEGDLGDGGGAREVQHLFTTLPTSINDQRLPLPVDLDDLVLGISTGTGEDQANITDDEGYVTGARTRFVSLFALPVPEYDDSTFYQTNSLYNTGEFTFPVNVGLEYKGTLEANWRKPELSSTDEYQNAVPFLTQPHNETVAINIPDENEALYVHREREDGPHQYGSYGINWFSRSTRSSVIKSLTTTFPSLNKLLPPGNVAPLLIREESPLLLTSAAEQTRLNNIAGADKTLIRLTFDFHTGHELLSYKITPEDLGSFTDPLHPDAVFPDSEEIFADEVDIYFRDELPQQVVGRVKSIANDLSNPVLSIVRTENYPLYSTGEELIPSLAPSQMPNFVGGVLIVEETEFVIHDVSPSTVAGEGPIFKVYKRELTDAVFAGTNSIPQAGADLQAPEVQADGKMLAIENMVSPTSWGGPNPHPLQVQIGDNWSIHREVIEREGPDDEPEQILEKFRGLYDDAAISPVTGETGVYQITFNSTQLAHHPQYNASGTSVDWYGGIVRVHTDADPNGPRKTLQVLQIQQIGSGQNVQLLVLDPQYGQGNDGAVVPISLGTAVSVHFYPGYKVYLHANAPAGITEANTLPATGEGTRYTIFGMRSRDTGSSGFTSKIGVPKMMFAQEILEPRVPEAPLGIPYTTRPDSFGKSTFTFTNQFTHRPHGLMYYRADDLLILNALYAPGTVAAIVEELAKPENAAFAVNRWQNVLGFDYTYTDPDTINTDGQFAYYPDTVDGYRLPNPDNPALFTGGGTPGNVAPGSMIDAMKTAIYQVFTTLTEMPLLYDHIRTDAAYIPKSGRQIVRDRNGALLSTTDPAFDIAPMAKVVGTNKVQFTDFGIDGTSGNLFFYTAREVGNTLKMGEFSDIFGPVKPVNAKAPVAPFIQRALPVLFDPISGADYRVDFEINRYAPLDRIKQVCLYRTLDPAKSLSTRMMDLVKTVDLDADGQLDNNTWNISDDFADLSFIPFGEPLYYRVVVMREIEYADKNQQVVIDYVASEPSKILVSNMVEVTPPVAPALSYTASGSSPTLSNVSLSWDKTSHNGRYLLYKQLSSGNWEKIYEVTVRDPSVSVDLSSTSLGSGDLSVEDADGNPIYHRFRVDVENTGGMPNESREVLTIGQ